MDAARNVPYRRIGTILVERQLITAEQLAHSLVVQEKKGGPLGEICVEECGLDRLRLADALSEQWEEMKHAGAESPRDGTAATETNDEAASVVQAEADAEADELRVLLEEAEAARAELASRTDELGRRLAALETLVSGVTDALADLLPVAPDKIDGNGANGHSQATSRPKRTRAGARTTTRRPASTSA